MLKYFTRTILFGVLIGFTLLYLNTAVVTGSGGFVVRFVYKRFHGIYPFYNPGSGEEHAVNTSLGKPLHQQASGNLKQNWDVDGEISIKILQHTPTHLTLKNSMEGSWVLILIASPFLIFGCLGLFLTISAKIFPGLFIIFCLIASIIILGVSFAPTQTVEFDKSE